MKSARIGIVIVVVISIAFHYQGMTLFYEIPCAVIAVARTRQGVPVIYRVIFLLFRLALRMAFVLFHAQDSEENSCLWRHFLSLVEHDPLVLHYKQIFHVLDFSLLPEPRTGPKGNSRRTPHKCMPKPSW